MKKEKKKKEKKEKKEKNKKLPLGRTVSNNMFALRAIFAASPLYLLVYLIEAAAVLRAEFAVFLS